MTGTVFQAPWLPWLLVWSSVAFALLAMTVVVVERAAYWFMQARRRRLARHYEPVVSRALTGDEAARRALRLGPPRHRIIVARLLVEPLIDDRDRERIVRAREVALAMSFMPVVDRYLQSQWWWRRAVALRVLGLLHVRDYLATIVAALDDSNEDVRAAALDALIDLRDLASLQAVVIRMHDATLHRGRRAAALAAFGPECEGFLLELAHVDPQHRLNYARALAICGTARSRPVFCHWTRDTRATVRAAAFEGLGHVGVDQDAARLAIEALESDDAPVRAMAAAALHGWTGMDGAALSLARRLDDEWPVAVRAARSLQSMGPAGLAELQVWAERPDLAGRLARQMLWQESARC